MKQTINAFLGRLDAVSYTHLDVYKRQRGDPGPVRAGHNGSSRTCNHMRALTCFERRSYSSQRHAGTIAAQAATPQTLAPAGITPAGKTWPYRPPEAVLDIQKESINETNR